MRAVRRIRPIIYASLSKVQCHQLSLQHHLRQILSISSADASYHQKDFITSHEPLHLTPFPIHHFRPYQAQTFTLPITISRMESLGNTSNPAYGLLVAITGNLHTTFQFETL
jgi:hypothetical protein